MWTYQSTPDNNYLCHFGVMGMKWGKRKSDYSSTGIKSKIAKKKNDKVDEGFDNWKENEKRKQTAIDLGKKRNKSKMDYEKNSSDKALKSQYKKDNKEYKKALSKNTTYRKGDIKKEVDSDLSRKYLSEAKKVKKQLNNDTSNNVLKKKYNDLMSKHDIERANARHAPEVAKKRSLKKASMKRAMTMTIKAAATTALVTTGFAIVNKQLEKNGREPLNKENILKAAKTVKNILNYV